MYICCMIQGTNVVIPNGSVDPWHVLGKYTSDDPSVVWYFINGKWKENIERRKLLSCNKARLYNYICTWTFYAFNYVKAQ